MEIRDLTNDEEQAIVGFRPEHSDDSEFAWGEQNEEDLSNVLTIFKGLESPLIRRYKPIIKEEVNNDSMV
jgi:hypothetical protein